MNDTTPPLLTEEPPKPLSTVADLPKTWQPFAERVKAQEAEERKPKSLLSTITTRKRRRPFFGVICGPPGVGKTTFASKAPNPIFIQTERGTDQLTVARFPLVKTLNDYKAQIQALVNEPHDFETIVLDSLDGLEIAIWKDVCDKGKVLSMEDFGYGRGFTKARECWVQIMERLSSMSERWNVILIAHAQIKTITDPALSVPFDQWRMRLHEKSADVVKQSVDSLLFANISQVINKENPKARKGRAIVGEERELWTSPVSGIECKNRFGLLNPMPFEWDDLQESIDKFHDA